MMRGKGGGYDEFGCKHWNNCNNHQMTFRDLDDDKDDEDKRMQCQRGLCIANIAGTKLIAMSSMNTIAALDPSYKTNHKLAVISGKNFDSND